MSSPIIRALRELRQPELRESLLHTAQELAHRASIYGVVRVSYSYLATKCHCSRRTVIRHIQRLVDAHIIKKSVIWLKGNYCEINTYTFQLAWDTRPAGGSDKTSAKFPRPEEGEKHGSLREKIANLERGLRLFQTEGTVGYVTTVAEIMRLKALTG